MLYSESDFSVFLIRNYSIMYRNKHSKDIGRLNADDQKYSKLSEFQNDNKS